MKLQLVIKSLPPSVLILVSSLISIWDSIKSKCFCIVSLTLSGTTDVIVIKQKDNSLRCSPFFVQFSPLTVMLSSSPMVRITINNCDRDDISMKLNKTGEALFSNAIDMSNQRKLNSDQLERLQLNPGLNHIKFSVKTILKQKIIESNIFLFDHSVQFVIADIDGTITKSDIIGHIMSLFGLDWWHNGITKLFNPIQNNGYQLMYLSARSIGQSYLTRKLLRSIKQSNCYLPSGPLLVSPDPIFVALHREIIIKKPHEFKIACLQSVAELFDTNHQPFYAGFGNRNSDYIAYKSLGIPEKHIFMINDRSEIIRQRIPCSYTQLQDQVDLIFPPLASFPSDNHNYSSFMYWQNPNSFDKYNDEIMIQIIHVSRQKSWLHIRFCHQ